MASRLGVVAAGLAGLMSLACGGAGQGGEPAKIDAKGPLAGLPSAAGPHMEKVKALGDGEWVNLGKPADGEGYVYIYDVATDSWFNPPNKENAVELPASNGGVLNYDSVADRVVVFRKAEYVAAWNPDTYEWTPKVPMPPKFPGVSYPGYHGFYSPAANAHFIWIAGDGSDNGAMWVYRLKKIAK